MCMMSATPSGVSVDKEEVASSGKSITNSNPLFKSNRSSTAKTRKINRSLRINKPSY